MLFDQSLISHFLSFFHWLVFDIFYCVTVKTIYRGFTMVLKILILVLVPRSDDLLESFSRLSDASVPLVLSTMLPG